ncbi:MAG: tRNA pseudouridine(38-40) synthase [Bacillariaceae sp.]|jgi:tRNA pseudouridine(38-40) synthase
MKFVIAMPWAVASVLISPIKQLLAPLLLPVVNSFCFFESTTTNNRRQSLTTMRIGTADNTVTNTVDNGITNTMRSNDDYGDDKRRSLRRKIPYVETFEEQIVRELWEKKTFAGAEHVVDAVIDEKINDRNKHSKISVILTPIITSSISLTSSSSSSSSPLLSGYENLFDSLYKQRDNDIEESSISKDNPYNIEISNSTNERGATKDKLKHFCLHVAYKGNDFCGWQTQPNNFEKPSVQKTLEDWLTILQDEPQKIKNKKDKKYNERRRKQQEGLGGGGGEEEEEEEETVANAINNYSTTTNDNNIYNNKVSPEYQLKRANLRVSGRTDRGVNAIGQVCRFRTGNNDLTPEIIDRYLSDQILKSKTTSSTSSPNDTTSNNDLSRSLRVTDIIQVSRSFHPTFTTSCRAYAYLVDIENNSSKTVSNENTNESKFSRSKFQLLTEERAVRQVALLDRMLRKLEGKSLDYIGLSYGKVKTTTTECTLHHVRARLVRYSDDDSGMIRKAVCIELVGNRFLRRMIRLLAEASMRLLAVADAKANAAELSEDSIGTTTDDDDDDDDALLNLISRHDRTLVRRPAPPDGLIFVGAKLESL